MVDTVGFIQKLPTELVAAFKSTLEEVAEANLVLHVIDISSELSAAQTAAVDETLEILLRERMVSKDNKGSSKSSFSMPRQICVWNKIDALTEERRAEVEEAAVLRHEEEQLRRFHIANRHNRVILENGF